MKRTPFPSEIFPIVENNKISFDVNTTNFLYFTVKICLHVSIPLTFRHQVKILSRRYSNIHIYTFVKRYKFQNCNTQQFCAGTY